MVVYPLLYLLIPKFLVQKKFVLFFASFAGLLFLCAFTMELLKIPLQIHKNDAFKGFTWTVGKNVLPFVHVAGLATAVKLIKYSYFQQQQASDALQKKTQAELELLKAQIHPHFLFNTLNNLFAHTMKQSSESPDIVLKLSDLLRFMIYDSRAEFIPLKQEITLLKNYIDLEKMRYGDRLDISLTSSGDIEDKMIAPLILLPLIENSFKHGIAKQIDQSWISLDIQAEGNKLKVKLVNSRDADKEETKKAYRGIGLENVQRRLELIYPGKHSVEIGEEEDYFLVHLVIDLDAANQKIPALKNKPWYGNAL
jgi:LytS/YehU family sensor histidine kinase